MSRLEIIFLGTSSGLPTRERAHTSLAVRRDGRIFLFDVGEGTQRQLIRAGVGLKRKTKIFISHLHGDHISGLLGLLQSLSLMGRSDPIDIYGPKGIAEYVEANVRMLNVHTGFSVRVQRISDGTFLDEKEYVIKALRTPHSVETYSYSLEEKPRPGKFNPEKATELGIPIRLWRDLKEGKRVMVGGEVVDTSQIVSPPRRGRKIVISGDTPYNEELATFARGADILIHDSTYGDEHADKARENLHSTARQAAEIASKAGVSLLVLTHFSARYADVSILVNQAREVFPQALAAEDLLCLEVPYPENT